MTRGEREAAMVVGRLVAAAMIGAQGDVTVALAILDPDVSEVRAVANDALRRASDDFARGLAELP